MNAIFCLYSGMANRRLMTRSSKRKKRTKSRKVRAQHIGVVNLPFGKKDHLSRKNLLVAVIDIVVTLPPEIIDLIQNLPTVGLDFPVLDQEVVDAHTVVVVVTEIAAQKVRILRLTNRDLAGLLRDGDPVEGIAGPLPGTMRVTHDLLAILLSPFARVPHITQNFVIEVEPGVGIGIPGVDIETNAL